MTPFQANLPFVGFSSFLKKIRLTTHFIRNLFNFSYQQQQTHKSSLSSPQMTHKPSLTEDALRLENETLKSNIKQLQKVMDHELQDTDNQFIEKVKQLEQEYSKKLEEAEAFGFLAAQEAKVKEE